jgi:hypothetical protein
VEANYSAIEAEGLFSDLIKDLLNLKSELDVDSINTIHSEYSHLFVLFIYSKVERGLFRFFDNCLSTRNYPEDLQKWLKKFCRDTKISGSRYSECASKLVNVYRILNFNPSINVTFLEQGSKLGLFVETYSEVRNAAAHSDVSEKLLDRTELIKCLNQALGILDEIQEQISYAKQ